jgi:hypothetical protein
VICVSQQRLFLHGNLANIAKAESRAPRHRALSLPVFSPIIGTFGYAKQIANIAKHQRAIGNLGNQKQIAKTANGPTARPLDRSTARPPDRDRPRTRHAHQAWIVMPIRSVIVLLARSLFAFGFLLAKPPPRADGLAGQGRWAHKKFFYFYPPNRLTAH